MRIVRIQSGLGNQMFQYAFYRDLLDKFTNVKIDLTYIHNHRDHNGYELKKIFNIVENVATEEAVKKFSDDNLDGVSRIRRKYLFRRKTHFKPKSFRFDYNHYNIDNAILDGYWHSEKYFKDIENIIRHEFMFRIPLEGKNKEISSLINSTNAVSIHIRRGDYFLPQYKQKFGSVCTLQYYKNAINYIEDRIHECRYYIFSNDINWCRDNLQLSNAVYIDWNTKENSYIDMQLMSMCKHNIIANSSFSWWAAWLNINTEKIVLAPDIWFNDKNIDTSDVIPKEWIRIRTQK